MKPYREVVFVTKNNRVIIIQFLLLPLFAWGILGTTLASKKLPLAEVTFSVESAEVVDFTNDFNDNPLYFIGENKASIHLLDRQSSFTNYFLVGTLHIVMSKTIYRFYTDTSPPA